MLKYQGKHEASLVIILNVGSAFGLYQKDLLPQKSLQKSTFLVLKPFGVEHFKNEK